MQILLKSKNTVLITVKKKKDELIIKQAKLESDLVHLVNLESELATQINYKNRLMDSLKEQKEEAHVHVLELDEQEQLLDSQQAAIQKTLEEARLKAERKRNKPIKSSGAPSSTDIPKDTPTVSIGHFTKPSDG